MSAKVENISAAGRDILHSRLNVIRVLRIKALGKCAGRVTCGRLEIKNGGEVHGDFSIYS
ncbi:MAG: hypothetical protein CMM26_08180 [Rhodospirillaceae bacterium]|nr:hypothetical protein [Rhodospirillaceae bacterium]|tara:strand:+ start:337 stop:516 length:180 start_codon:yes stop_codon:yes gene_type:complete